MWFSKVSNYSGELQRTKIGRSALGRTQTARSTQATHRIQTLFENRHFQRCIPCFFFSLVNNGCLGALTQVHSLQKVILTVLIEMEMINQYIVSIHHAAAYVECIFLEFSWCFSGV